jgi:hypothetical protein
MQSKSDYLKDTRVFAHIDNDEYELSDIEKNTCIHAIHVGENIINNLINLILI